jgi:hypothetical protein
MLQRNRHSRCARAGAKPWWRRMGGLFLGIDVGTGGVRACAIDAQAGIHGLGLVALPPPRIDGDAIDQQPEFWWQAAVAAIGKLGGLVDIWRNRTHCRRWYIRNVVADGRVRQTLLTGPDVQRFPRGAAGRTRRRDCAGGKRSPWREQRAHQPTLSAGSRRHQRRAPCGSPSGLDRRPPFRPSRRER